MDRPPGSPQRQYRFRARTVGLHSAGRLGCNTTRAGHAGRSEGMMPPNWPKKQALKVIQQITTTMGDLAALEIVDRDLGGEAYLKLVEARQLISQRYEGLS